MFFSTGVIDVLVRNGRQIEAVNMAYAFGLTEQFAPVPLLKAYLKDVKKTSQAKAGNTSPSAAEVSNISTHFQTFFSDLSFFQKTRKVSFGASLNSKCLPMIVAFGEENEC